MAYNFSVGKLTLKSSGVTVKSITQAVDISVDHTLNTHKEYGPEGTVISEVVESEEITVTCSFLEGSYDTSLVLGQQVDLELTQGGPNGATGITLTLANCKITGYKVKESQGAFVSSDLTLSKLGGLTDSSVVKETVKFGTSNIYIGDSASVEVSYEGNVIDYVIPTALGIGIMTTQYVGGGKLNIKVNGYVEKAHHLEVEQYLINLYTSLQTAKGTLTVAYGLTTYTIENVVFQRGSASGGKGKYGTFTCEFVKSAY